MKYTSYLLVTVLLFMAFVMSCEKDDICAEGTSTTPQLIIRFYDIAEPDEFKDANNLFAFGLDDMDTGFNFEDEGIETRDSIAIPLPLDTNTTRFVLNLDSEIDDNGTPDDTSDDLLLGNSDIITVNYEREDVYVSRACGYKTIFNNISFSVTAGPDGDTWITTSEIVIDNVINQNAAHVKIFH